MTLWLTSARISRAPSAAALGALIDPEAHAHDTNGQGRRFDAHHRLIWTLFAGDPSARRDFLWRDDGAGLFTILSHRAPEPVPLFDPIESRAFEPDLKARDRLRFRLRANATKARKGAGRVDVVMDRLHGIEPEDRAARRSDLAQKAARDWMAGQGDRAGFVPHQVLAEHYSTATLPRYRGKRAGEPRYGILDLAGVIEITDPDLFLPALGRGFGRAKAFGCGLMLLRRG